MRADFQRMEAERFASHGPGWSPLTPATVSIKTRRGRPLPDTPMHGTGALVASLVGDTEHTVHQVSPDELLVDTNAPYAQYHQVGPRTIRVFGRGSAHLPQRRIVDISAADAARWAAIVQAALMRPGRTGGPSSSYRAGGYSTPVVPVDAVAELGHHIKHLRHQVRHVMHQAHRVERYLNG